MSIFGALQNHPNMITPSKKHETNLNNDLGGGTFMTETKPMSRINLNSKSPDGRKTSVDEMMNTAPNPHFPSMTNPASP